MTSLTVRRMVVAVSSSGGSCDSGLAGGVAFGRSLCVFGAAAGSVEAGAVEVAAGAGDAAAGDAGGVSTG